MKQYDLMKGSSVTSSRAVLMDKNKTKHLLEIVKSPGQTLTSPAALAGIAGLMAQLAMQQSMQEITDYLATIDAKIDELLRAQKDAVVADMIGAELVIDDAVTVRDQVGKVSELTWSKVQTTPLVIARTQAYALRQLDGLAAKLEDTTKLGDLAKAANDAQSEVQGWLAVLARCHQLQDSISVLELDRMLEAAPEELEQHRLGVRAARQKRLDLISTSTERLLARIDAAAGTANAKVLLHPASARTVVTSSAHVLEAVEEFDRRLGIERDREALRTRTWLAAATEVRDKVLDAGVDGAKAAGSLGNDVLDRAKSARGRLSSQLAERASRRKGEEKPAAEDEQH